MEERVRTAEKDSQSPRAWPPGVNKLTAENSLFTAETEQAKIEHVTLTTCVRELEVAAARRY